MGITWRSFLPVLTATHMVTLEMENIESERDIKLSLMPLNASGWSRRCGEMRCRGKAVFSNTPGLYPWHVLMIIDQNDQTQGLHIL